MFEKGNFAIKIEDQPVQVINKIQDPMTKVLYTPLIDNSVSTGHFLFPSEVHIWPETISTIFNRICSYIRKYIDIDEDCISIAASFAMMTHVYDRFEKVPYLRFFGPHGSGKSRALAIMRSICYHSINLGASQTAPNVLGTALSIAVIQGLMKPNHIEFFHPRYLPIILHMMTLPLKAACSQSI